MSSDELHPPEAKNTGRSRSRTAPANDNRAGAYTQFVAHNGGCSTTSGLVAVTLAERVAA